MKIHFDEQTVDADAGAVLLHFNVVHDEAGTPEVAPEAPVEEAAPADAPVEAAPEAPVAE